MGFKNRLKLVKDENALIERRVAALCNALTFCHLGYEAGIGIIKTKFNIEIGQPVSNKQLLDAASYLESEWHLKGRKSDG